LGNGLQLSLTIPRKTITFVLPLGAWGGIGGHYHIFYTSIFKSKKKINFVLKNFGGDGKAGNV
jgi:hypothetical protein